MLSHCVLTAVESRNSLYFLLCTTINTTRKTTTILGEKEREISGVTETVWKGLQTQSMWIHSIIPHDSAAINHKCVIPTILAAQR